MKPGPVLAAAALLWFLLGAVGFFSDLVSLIWLFSGLALIPIIAADGIVLYFLADRLSVRRSISSFLAQGESAKVTLTIQRGGRSFLSPKILLWDLYPLSMELEGSLPKETALPEEAMFPTLLNKKLLAKEDTVYFEYTLVPRDRGRWFFGGTEVLLSSFLRMWCLKVLHPCESYGRTYPNFKKITAKAGADLRGLLERTGVKNIRMRGQGLEFSSLRDYQEGDSIRMVDWRATSRKRKVIVREYQEEQDQQLLFLIDSGYRLNKFDSGISQFDSALEAVLLLSWVSLKHGDSVGVGSFGTGKRWISPRKGLSSFHLLMNGFYDLESTPSPSSPFSALEEALAHLRRRTFIILISNFREEDGESLSWILKRIEKKHLLLLVSLREKESEYLASRQPEGTGEALETAAAFSYLMNRRDLYRAWEHMGLLTMEAPAGELSAALINRYLEVKRSGRL